MTTEVSDAIPGIISKSKTPRKPAPRRPRQQQRTPDTQGVRAALDRLEARLDADFGRLDAEFRALSSSVSDDEVEAIKHLVSASRAEVQQVRDLLAAKASDVGGISEAQEELEESLVGMASQLRTALQRVDALNAGMEDLRRQLDEIHLRQQRGGSLNDILGTPVSTGMDLGHLLSGTAGVLAYAGMVAGVSRLTGQELRFSKRAAAAVFAGGAIAYDAV